MFDFKALALILGGISLGIAGVMMAGAMLWPEAAERYKKLLPTVLGGLVLVGVSGLIISALS